MTRARKPTWTFREKRAWTRARRLFPDPGKAAAFRRQTGAVPTWWTAWARCREATVRGRPATSFPCRWTRPTGCVGKVGACPDNSRWASPAGDYVGDGDRTEGCCPRCPLLRCRLPPRPWTANPTTAHRCPRRFSSRSRDRPSSDRSDPFAFDRLPTTS